MSSSQLHQLNLSENASQLVKSVLIPTLRLISSKLVLYRTMLAPQTLQGDKLKEKKKNSIIILGKFRPTMSHFNVGVRFIRRFDDGGGKCCRKRHSKISFRCSIRTGVSNGCVESALQHLHENTNKRYIFCKNGAPAL